ncbi:MAG: transcription-repair coupling factor [Acidobacteria bacterium]|nr:transcription-repair coupling factor [Acidobacteriota bacterium]MBI3424262.1 transcription-repair coupling factor [Acidobacteriota bacterium]
MSALFQRFEEDEQFQRLANEVRAGRRVVNVAGLANGAKALALAALQRATGKRLAVVSLRSKDLEALEDDLRFFYCTLNDRAECDNEVFVLPVSESDPYSGTSPHADILERRALALWRLTAGAGDIVLLTAHALLRRYVALDEIKQAGVVLRVGEELPLDYLLEHLVAVGYKRSDPVGGVGEFSSRGGILDFYSPSAQLSKATENATALLPVRVEFFGDEIDSIREFDPETQRSVRELKETIIAPMRDERATASDFRDWAKRARERWRDERYERALRDRTVFADEGEEFPGWEYLLPLLRPLSATVFDYLRDCVLVVDEPAEVEKQLRSLLDELQHGYERTERTDELGLPPEQLFLTPDELRTRLENVPRVEMHLLGAAALARQEELATEEVVSTTAAMIATSGAAHERIAAFVNRPTSAPLFLFPPEAKPFEVNLSARAVRRWHGRIPDLAAELKELSAFGQQTIFVLPSTGVADRLRKTLTEYQVTGIAGTDEAPSPKPLAPITLTVGDLSVGFALPNSKLTVYTEADIFDEAVHTDRASRTQAKSKGFKLGAFLSDFRDLKIGDYIVHIDHGIGQFQGLLQIDMAGPETSADIYARMIGAGGEKAESKREFMLLTYADGAKLYVPVERLDLVQKFASSETGSPSLDRLGGIAWAKTKARVKRAMRDMAEELLKLYAERKLVTGFAFSGDTPWQQEFEDAFPYELTVDQATAITDVKNDMEQPQPMDRLLCGDVGYGKTEVAMRAAFKSVMDGKQVAVLAPTTVLAYQHHQNFKARFAAFPAKIELLSRFRSPKEQKEVVASIETGAVDIVIGTHRILSRDLNFKELGLVIVDEEQRFGVAHKERLKQIKKRVDVLTMSATPIPRTLNMSLLGMRDMSVIETPPRDRLAIQTNVVPFNDAVIRSAIELELQRQGQVFFVHNRVESIEEVAALLKRIVPEARYIVAHGQMGEKEMEQAVLDFVAYKFDVLVATTIIENGIDIPRANTIIINRADNYGLSQLYQLRGRVGRASRRAYAYLLIPPEQELTPIARKRLAAIREFSDLGAGFRIAALDLELRGAGNLLGGQQSGQIDAVGFDLYTQMLERTVQELRGEPIEEDLNTQLNLGVDTRIPEEYVFDMSQRLRTYKRIASAKTDEDLQRIHEEVADRYGRLPESVENLFLYARVRREANQLGIVSIDRTGANLALKLSDKARVEPECLMKLLAENPAVSFTPSGVLKVKLEAKDAANADQQVFAVLSAVLQALQYSV